MARPSYRCAACAGGAVAVLLIGAPSAAVALADPGGSGAHSNHGGGGAGGGRSTDRKPNPGNNGPRTTIGSGRGDTASGNSSGRQAAERPDTQDPPTAKFGDGRSPHYEPPVNPPRQNVVPAVPAVPAPPPEVVATPPRPSLVDGLLSSSARVRLEGARSDPMTEPLLGLAGLVLLPAAGAVLGYRQAKAAEAARGLGRP